MHHFNQKLFIFYLFQLFAWSSSKYLYDDFMNKMDRLSDYGKKRAERNDPISDQLEDSQYAQDDEESVDDKIDWIKRNPNKFQNFLISLNSEKNLKSKRQVQFDKALLTYPEVIANPVINNIQNQAPSDVRPDGIMSYGSFLNFVDPSATDVGNNSKVVTTDQQSKVLTTDQQSKVVTTDQQTPPATNVTTSSPTVPRNESECSRFLNSDNATAVLEKVLEELELIRNAKEGNATPEGAPCEISGSWNSEVIGLRFDITAGNDSTNELIVKLHEHNPPKRVTLMNTNWTSSGYSLKRQGGPFYLWASKNKEDILATFTGVCKNCGNSDTIFGTWSIVHPAKDCRDLQMAIETKRDIFRKESVHIKKQEKLSKIKKNSKTDSEFV